ncbi:MAG: erythromycin esterase family protein [Bradymonadaceae bacterium]
MSQPASASLECFGRYRPEAGAYVQGLRRGEPSCGEAIGELVEIVDRVFAGGEKENFVVRQDARVVASAEAHYRANLTPGGASWNARAEHMHVTAQKLLEVHGAESRGIVWAHNTHIGDARATTMHEQQRVNIGQLSRQDMGDGEVFAIGFGTHRGAVKAGRSWGASMERMNVPAGMAESYEEIFHRLGEPALWVIFDEAMRENATFRERRGHRAIGVIYHPEREAPGNYVPTDLFGRYDAFIFIDETNPVRPL